MVPILSTVAILLLSVTAASGYDKSCNASGIPSSIDVPSGNKLQTVLYGVGLQHYTFNGSSWVNDNVSAALYQNPQGEVVGHHYFLPIPDAQGGQPTWKTYEPESIVTAKSLVAVTVDPKSITWNSFVATSTSGSKDLLGAVTYLQRINAKSGLPPSTEGAQTGDTHESPYSIIYAYYVQET